MLKVRYQTFYVNASVWKKKDECELNGETWIRAAQGLGNLGLGEHLQQCGYLALFSTCG